MKLLEKFVLIIYSLFMLIISAITCLLIFKIINIDNISTWINFVLEDNSLSIIVLAVSVIFILLSIRCLFFRKHKQIKKSNETDILLENESGRLLISKRSIENCVKNVINEIINSSPEIKVTVDIDPASNLSIYIAIILDKSVKVRDFTVGLQSRIKEKIKESFDLEVKQVNIKIDSMEKVEIKKEDIKIGENKQVLEEKEHKEEKELIEVNSEENKVD